MRLLFSCFLIAFANFERVVIAEAFPIETQDFKLWDSKNNGHTMSYYSDKSAIVFIAFPDNCRSKKELFSWYSRLEPKLWANKAIIFWVNAQSNQDREKVNREVSGYFFAPVLMDDSQVTSRRFGFKNAGDYVVIDPKGWQKTASGNWADGGIEKMLKVEKIKLSATHPTCQLKFRDNSRLIWDGRVAKAFQNN